MARKKTARKSRAKSSSRKSAARSRPSADAQNTVVGVLGQKGTGKSYWLKRYVDKLPASRRVVVWDSMSEYAGEYSRNAIKRARLVRSMRELLLLRSKLPNRVVIQAPRSEFALFCRWAIRGATRGVGQTIVVDEVNLYCRAGSAPVELLELMRIGRHASVDFLFSARRPSEISRDLTAQADVLRIFRTLEPIDLDWFKKRCGKRFADTLTVLPKYHSAVFSGVLEDAQATHIDPPI